MASSWQRIRAYAILFCSTIILQLFHLILFLFNFSTGIILQVGFYFFQKTFYETVSPFGLESLITLLVVGIGATIAVEKSKNANASINALAITRPVLFFTIPNLVCSSIFALCFVYISIQFFTVPTSKFGILHENAETSGVYLLCASYIVYVVASICYKDRNYIRDRIFGYECCQFIAFIITCLLQVATVFMIFKPILEIQKKYLISFGYEPTSVFGYMLLLASVMGVAAGAIEKYAHCVVHKRKAPFYWYENSVEARNCTLQCLAFPIHYGLFKPNKVLPINAFEEHFIYFSICSSLAWLQFTKILYLIVFDHKNLDVVCGYSPRTSARLRLSNNRRRPRSPRVFSFRSSTTNARQDNTQHYEGNNNQTEEPDRNNNNNNSPPKQNRNNKLRSNNTGQVKPEKISSTSFMGIMFPVEMPIIFMTGFVFQYIMQFVAYAHGVKSPEETVTEEIPAEMIENRESQGDVEQPHCSSTVKNDSQIARSVSQTPNLKSIVVNVEIDQVNANIGDSGEHINVDVNFSGNKDTMSHCNELPINTTITTTIEQ